MVKNESYFQILEPATGAQAYRLDPSDSGRRGLLIRSDGSNPALLQDEIITAWSRLSGTEPSYTHIDDVIESSFSMETRVTKLLGVAALFTIVLSTIGMCGLVSSVLVSQSKFIAIRTVFGANSWSVMTLYCMRFSMPIFIAILVGCPAAVFLALEWIERFPYQLGKTTVSLIGLGAAALSMLLSWAVICILSMLILRRKPSELLRTE